MDRTNVLSLGAALFILYLVCVAPPCVAKITSGDLDPTFGTDGKVTTYFGVGDGANALAIDGTGKIVVAGFANYSDTGNAFILARYNTDGSLDTTFGTNGMVATDFFGSNDEAHALAIDSQGRIIVAGNAYIWKTTDWYQYFALARYNNDGSLDTTFGTNGKVTTQFGQVSVPYALAIGNSDKIVLAGTAYGDFALARYNADGSLDTTFGTDGKVTTEFGEWAQVHALAIDSSGKIVVAGGVDADPDVVLDDFALARYNTDGSLDTTFGTDGKVTTDFGGEADVANGIAIDNSGKIIATGFADWHKYFALARYNTDGSLDTTFGTNGKVTTDFGVTEYGGYSEANALTIDNNGKIVAAGRAQVPYFYDFALARYNADGSLDTTFGTKGKVTTDFSGYAGGDWANALGIDGSGKIVLAGFSNSSFALARYIAGETNPPSGSIIIKGGTEATKRTEVTLALTASDDTPGKIRMCISNTMTCTTWAAFAETTSWTLTSGNGTKTVYVWFKDVWGNVNDTPYSDTIILDTKDPTDGTLTAVPGNAQVALEWTGFTDTGSDVESYKVVFAVGIAPLSCSTRTVVYSGTDTSCIHTDLTNGTKYGYRVCAIDEAGNISTGATANAKPRPELNPPTGSITIKGGAEATKSRNLTLTLTATDATSGAIKMCISNTAICTTWTALAESKSWTLTTGNGMKTVNVWFRDVWGNANDTPYFDTILLDTIAPTNGTVTATPGAAQVTLEWTGFADTGSGIGDYKVVFSKGSAPASCSEGKQIYNGPDTTYLHTGLTSGTTYYYRVCAIDEAGNISTGKTAKAKPQ
jgi:uncharacterized delta-60 repeat protein